MSDHDHDQKTNRTAGRRLITPSMKLPPKGQLDVDVVGAHTHSIANRDEIALSKLCGCFYCCSTFVPSRITSWVDRMEGVVGAVTAMCPKCNLDSVIGDASGYSLDETFLRAMRKRWFETTVPWPEVHR